METKYSLDDFSSVTSAIERFIERENETIALYERSLHSLGDTLVTPMIHRMIEEKEQQRRLLEQTLQEVNEQFSLDEAIV
jgi:rubrerythrin